MQELLYQQQREGIWTHEQGKMVTKLAMTCLSHMVLSPVGLQQIGNERQHMASAALRLRVRVLLPSLSLLHVLRFLLII